jgi:hypothetical protein
LYPCRQHTFETGIRQALPPFFPRFFRRLRGLSSELPFFRPFRSEYPAQQKISHEPETLRKKQGKPPEMICSPYERQ